MASPSLSKEKQRQGGNKEGKNKGEKENTRISTNVNRADTFQDGQARGALSWAFVKSLKQWPHQSYLQLLNTIRNELEDKYSQKPQLSCSHPLGKYRGVT